MFHVVGVPVVQRGIKEFISESFVGCIVASTECLVCKVWHAHLYASEGLGVLLTSSTLAELAFSLAHVHPIVESTDRNGERVPNILHVPRNPNEFLAQRPG